MRRKEVCTTNCNLVEKERLRLEKKLKAAYEQMKDLPDGTLHCKASGKYRKMYIKDNGTVTYINRTMRPLAEKLAVKKYLSLLIEELQLDIKFLDSYLATYQNGSRKSELLLSKTSEYQKLLTSYFKPVSSEMIVWMNAPYDQNTNYPEHLIHSSCTGHMLRSKSESLIDIALYMYQIPFRYECALQLGLLIFYPDFTIRHPHTGQIIIWEHFGMMDDPVYAKNAYDKLQIYAQNGYIPSVNMIITFETKDHPLSFEKIQETIQSMILSISI